jgi:hypothetical protein
MFSVSALLELLTVGFFAGLGLYQREARKPPSKIYSAPRADWVAG